MIIDARRADCDLAMTADVAIIGAGAAGIALARDLAKSWQVIVLESGGVEAEVGALHGGTVDVVGLPYPVEDTRRGGFGGSTSIWAGYCALFDEGDFWPDPEQSLGGWAMSRGDLLAYYRPAGALLNLPDGDFDAQALAERIGTTYQFSPDLSMDVWRFGQPTARFSKAFRTSIAKSRRINVMTHTNAVDLRLADDGQTVSQVTIRTREGRVGHLGARVIVLAAGGIESARLLMNSDSQVAGGLGNAGGMVGRCFMEHPHLPIPGLTGSGDARLAQWTTRFGVGEALGLEFLLGLAPAARRGAGLLNARAHAFYTPDMQADESARFGLFLEQEPNPASRLVMIQDRDALGLRCVELDWRLTPRDWVSYRATARRVGAGLVRAGLAVGDTESWIDTIDESAVLHSNHHLGTTRMSADAKSGVVDSQCRVHGTKNLYVAGGSVFPTGSWANPTMTVLALTARLADHLRDVLGRKGGVGTQEGSG